MAGSVSIDRRNLRAQLLRETQVTAQALEVFAGQFACFRRLYKQRGETAVKGFRHSCSGSDHFRIGRAQTKGRSECVPGFRALFLALLQRRAVELIRGAPHGDLTQGGQNSPR